MILENNSARAASEASAPTLTGKDLLRAVARGLALFFGGFSLLNLLGSLYIRGFNVNNWWIDFHPAPAAVANVALCIFAMCLLGFGLGNRALWWRWASITVCLGVLGVVAGNVRAYNLLRAHGAFFTSPPAPVSLFLFGALLLLLIGMWNSPTVLPARWGRAVIVITLLLCMVGFPLAQIFLFGATDYRRQADVIVVLGAKACADGSCSFALSDRVRTACLLYHQGLAPRLLMSGGVAEGGMTEPEAMRRLAVRLGVPNADIVLDTNGRNTHATVRDSIALFTQYHMNRVLVVSHFFHLPRIKMAYQRAGWNVFTVPVDHPELPARQLPFLVTREVAGLWSYYLCPLWGHTDEE